MGAPQSAPVSGINVRRSEGTPERHRGIGLKPPLNCILRVSLMRSRFGDARPLIDGPGLGTEGVGRFGGAQCEDWVVRPAALAECLAGQ